MSNISESTIVDGGLAALNATLARLKKFKYNGGLYGLVRSDFSDVSLNLSELSPTLSAWQVLNFLGPTNWTVTANVQTTSIGFGDGNDALFTKKGISVDANMGAGNDTAIGADLVDYLNGGAGNDKLDGQGDDDFIVGGSGNDTLTGGSGNDDFVFIYIATDYKSSVIENDIITDFNKSQDQIKLSTPNADMRESKYLKLTKEQTLPWIIMATAKRT